jgi:two-component system chemotaxis sensor kinase CheA
MPPGFRPARQGVLLMDELLRDFLTETNESLDVVDVELVRLEQEPNNADIIANVFRLVHTIKGTCGFLSLPRLAALAHAAESMIGKFRDGAPVTADAITLILSTIDRIKGILESLEKRQCEPEGDDADLIRRLDGMVARERESASEDVHTYGSLVYQVLERPLRLGEASLDELERAFRETPAPPLAAAAGNQDIKSEDKAESRIANQSIRVHVDTLEHLMTMVSELVLTRNQLLELARRQSETEFKVPLQRLSHVTAELQESVMKTRMQPIGNAWQKLPRIVRDLAAELGKQIDLEMHGADTELDRQVLDLIRDPLTHMIRNSADHGIESPQERVSAGKPERGTIRLTAYHEGGHIIIEVADDGRGLNSVRIRDKALAQGLASESDIARMSEAQIHRFIFTPGFSTASRITSISGRGVGMDVVLNNIDQIGGTIDVKSVGGEGSVFVIKIPLTLAIVSALIIAAGGERFAVPQLAVVELVRVKKDSEHRIERIKDTPVLRLRNKLLPLVHLTRLLRLGETPDADSDNDFVVVMQVGAQTVGVVVDAVFHTEEIVVKPMATRLRHIPVFSGNTILGDGSVIMILDPNGIAGTFGAAATQAAKIYEAAAGDGAPESGREKTSLLVFRAGSASPKAVPLSLVTRLEEIDVEKIEITGGRHMIQYRRHLMPLIRINGEAQIRTEGTQPLLVFSDGARSMALVVDQIIDIVEDVLDIEATGEEPGILGSAIVKGEATEIVDVGHFLPLAFGDWFRRKDQGANRRRNLLLVEDSAFFRDMLVPVLTAAGYGVIAAAGGREALAILKGGARFDAIVTDLDMPEMDGMALAAAVRADARIAATPLIALSSAATDEAVARVRAAGFHDFVAKFDRQGLVAALKEQLADADRAA